MKQIHLSQLNTQIQLIIQNYLSSFCGIDTFSTKSYFATYVKMP